MELNTGKWWLNRIKSAENDFEVKSSVHVHFRLANALREFTYVQVSAMFHYIYIVPCIYFSLYLYLTFDR